MNNPRHSLSAQKPVVELIASAAVPGCLRGLTQSSLRVHLRFSGEVDALWPQRAAADLSPLPAVCQSPQGAAGGAQTAAAFAVRVAEFFMRVQLSAGIDVHTFAVLERMRPLPGDPGRLEAVVLVPAPLPGALETVVPAGFVALSEPQVNGPAMAAAVAGLLEALSKWAPGGSNNRHLLRAAGARGIPVIALPGSVFQLGWGRRSRLFKSTLSDGTSSLATGWARSKSATNKLLRMAGLPVPQQEPVSSWAAALQAAQMLGYPVVLKPVDLDQGLGVEADLRDDAELRVAYERAVRHGRPLVMEKHVPGEDYRVYVVDGQVMGVSHRVPAHVMGDGVSTVARLVADENARRRLDGGQASVLKPIELDPEALELLAREGLGLEAVPPADSRVRLRRAANTSRGGTTRDVTAQIHPDNAALCLQVAALLRLDIAGLDLLMADIARSWRDVGAAFCEVNAQPQMGAAHPWIFDRVLQRFVTAQGRIPAVMVLGPSADIATGQAVARAMEDASRGPVEWVHGRGVALFERTRACVMRPDLGAVVVQTDGVGLAVSGLPLDRFDVLVVLEWPRLPGERPPAMAWLAHHARSVVWLKAGGGAGASGKPEDFERFLIHAGALPQREVLEVRAVPEAVTQLLAVVLDER